MRDLGTPFYPRRFFKTIREKFSSQSNIAVVRLRQKPVAAAFLVHYRNKMEMPWAKFVEVF
jgi:serine/alanine adding enzyme